MALNKSYKYRVKSGFPTRLCRRGRTSPARKASLHVSTDAGPAGQPQVIMKLELVSTESKERN
jgi:hypothetical protein